MRIAILTFCLVLISSLAIYFYTADRSSYQDLKKSYRASDYFIYDRKGVLLAAQRSDFNTRKFAWLSYNEIPQTFIKLLLKQEDKGFFSHYGISLSAIMRAAYSTYIARKKQGASTITMQLVSLLNKKTNPSVLQKISEIMASLVLETQWTKEEILESYIQLVSFRGEIVGLRAAALLLFGKTPDALSIEEQAFLVAMISNPNAKREILAKKACRLVTYEDCAIFNSIDFLDKKLTRLPVNPTLVNGIRRLTHDAKTTLDNELQDTIEQSARRLVGEVKNRNVHDVAVLVVSNHTGEVLSYVPNSSTTVSSNYVIRKYVDGVRARRSVGSTLKPFLYATAFEEGFLKADSLLEDSPLQEVIGIGSYMPENYDKSYRGKVMAAEALASSLNIPAVRLLDLVGVEYFAQKLKGFGIQLPEASDRYGLSLILGSPSLSLFELVRAYRVLSNAGMYADLKASTSEEKSFEKKVLSDESRKLILAILSNKNYRATTFGLENALTTKFFSVVKTGTSRDMVDNWCIGFTDRVTVGVWVGNFDGSPMWNVTGVTGAAPIWNEVITKAQARAIALGIPASITKEDLEFAEQISFYPQETNATAKTNEVKNSQILSPENGEVLAFDVDAGEKFSRLPIRFYCKTKHCTVLVEGEEQVVEDEGLVLWENKLKLKGSIRIGLLEGGEIVSGKEIVIR